MAQTAEYFKALTDGQLNFAIKDIGEALRVVGRGNPVAENKYLDQLHYATAEKHRREGKHSCPTCHRPL